MKNKKSRFEELTQYIVPISKSDRFGEWSSSNGNGSAEDPYQWPYVNFDELVTDFEKSVYTYIEEHPEYELNRYSDILEDNNIKWDQLNMRNADVDKLDSQCILALIIASIRAERFCAGALLDFFEKGLILKWLKRLKELDEVLDENSINSINDEYSYIRSFQASVGGYFGGYYEIELNFDNRQLKWKHYGAGKEEFLEKRVQRKTLEKFREGLKKLDIISWKDKYIEPGICDGTQWSIEIDIDGRIKKIIGDNKFPKEWSDFCDLMRKITNKQFR